MKQTVQLGLFKICGWQEKKRVSIIIVHDMDYEQTIDKGVYKIFTKCLLFIIRF